MTVYDTTTKKGGKQKQIKNTHTHNKNCTRNKMESNWNLNQLVIEFLHSLLCTCIGLMMNSKNWFDRRNEQVENVE